VALQFPDDLMSASVTVVQLLQQLTAAEVVILADTSYGRWNLLIILYQLVKSNLALLLPFTSAWPHLRCGVGLEEGEYCVKVHWVWIW